MSDETAQDIVSAAMADLERHGARLILRLLGNDLADSDDLVCVNAAPVSAEAGTALQEMEGLLWRMRYLLVEAVSDGGLIAIRNELGSLWTEGAQGLITEHNEFVKRWGSRFDEI